MTLQQHEFEFLLRDAERLRLFVQASMAEREMHSLTEESRDGASSL